MFSIMSEQAPEAAGTLRALRTRDALRFGPWLPWLGAIAFVVAGILMVVAGSRWWLEYRRSQSWPTASAQVESVEREPREDGFRIRCIYRFTHDGHQYRSSRVTLSGQGYAGGGGHEDAEYVSTLESLEHHRTDGTPVTCFVNASDPTQSVLLRRFETRMWALPMAGLAFALWGPVLLFLYYRSVGTE